MYFRTHLIITLFAILLLWGVIDSKIYFVLFAVLGTLAPDIDTRHSKLGKKSIFRPIQFFFNHRGPIHSVFFMCLICIPLYFWHPAIAFGFALGYGLHLIADSFTRMGIYLFWPYQKRFYWKIKTGGNVEFFIFVLLIIVCFLLVLSRFLHVF